MIEAAKARMRSRTYLSLNYSISHLMVPLQLLRRKNPSMCQVYLQISTSTLVKAKLVPKVLLLVLKRRRIRRRRRRRIRTRRIYS